MTPWPKNPGPFMQISVVITGRPCFNEFNTLSFHAETKMAALGEFKKVLITDKIDSVCKKVLEENGIEVVMKPGLAKEAILNEIKVNDVFITSLRHS